MTLTLVSADSKLRAECVWTLKRRDESGLFVPVIEKKNLVTNNGLSALASAWGGGYAPPLYMVIDNFYSTTTSLRGVGSTTISTFARVDVAGDSQFVIEPGLAGQEICNFSSVTGTGPYTYNLSIPTTISHPITSKVVRQVALADGLSSVLTEQQFDATNSPMLRAQLAAGYSTGPGNWTSQFYFTSTQANVWLMTLGLSENQNVGAGSLHNHIIFAYDNTAGASDLEVDVSLTLT